MKKINKNTRLELELDEKAKKGYYKHAKKVDKIMEIFKKELEKAGFEIDVYDGGGVVEYKDGSKKYIPPKGKKSFI